MSKAPRRGRVTFNSVKVALRLTRSNSRPAHAANSSPYGAMLFVTCKRNLNGKNGMLRWLGLGLLLGTGFGIAWAQGSTKFDGQYRG